MRFVPTSIVLPGGASMRVVPAVTRQGVLDVPRDLAVAGWWDGGAWAGDPYGTTVIAAHVDSAEQGVGLFADLLEVKPGAKVTVRAGRNQAAYRVTRTETVRKQALATGTEAFDQRGPHRLVLVTCTGRFDPATRSYDSNFVVFAEPLGPAT
jgi:LPXTG-site transpeptidase (sortase) family protein